MKMKKALWIIDEEECYKVRPLDEDDSDNLS